jgi:hypothetical protein
LDYSFYTPNADDDGHNTDVAYADTWIGNHVMPLLSNSKFMKDMLVVITFDENDDASGGTDEGPTTPGKNNQIYTALYGSMVKAGSTSSAQYDHHSMMRTIENALGTGTLGQGDETAKPISGVWK